jgi:hypothetical protein
MNDGPAARFERKNHGHFAALPGCGIDRHFPRRGKQPTGECEQGTADQEEIACRIWRIEGVSIKRRATTAPTMASTELAAENAAPQSGACPSPGIRRLR